MKKILSAMLAAGMMVSMAVPAFAAVTKYENSGFVVAADNKESRLSKNAIKSESVIYNIDFGPLTADFGSGTAIVRTKMTKQDYNLYYTNYADAELVDKIDEEYGSSDLTFFDWRGHPNFGFNACVKMYVDKNTYEEAYLYKVDDNGKLTELKCKYDEKTGEIDYHTKTLGKYVVSNVELD